MCVRVCVRVFFVMLLRNFELKKKNEMIFLHILFINDDSGLQRTFAARQEVKLASV